MKSILIILAAATSALLSANAQAAILQYVINGQDTLAANQVEFASFRIDTDRAPDGFADGIGLFFAAVPGVFTYGATTTVEPQDITFYLDASNGYNDPTTDPGGLFVGEGDLLGFGGPQLFSGPLDRPTLLTGSFILNDAFSGSAISLTVSAVPEPATWAMMTLGFGAMGFAMRRKLKFSTGIRFA